MTETRPVVFLHIGATKTGTTYLQNLIVANKEHLAAAGYLFPGDTWVRQVRAVQDVIDGTRGDPRVATEAQGAWAALAREVLDHTGTASIISMEFLSFADARRAKRAVTSLRPAEVHVILTVRDATATIPALWQTSVHNGSPRTWEEFRRGVREAGGVHGRLARVSPNRPLRTFKREQDIERMLHAWGRHVNPQRVHVVTVPPPGSDPYLLWDRFAYVLGVDPAVCSEQPARANESLGYASTELLRRVNVELGQLRPTDYNPTLKEGLALRVLFQRRGEESRARIDHATCEFALAWNQRTRKAIVDRGVDLVGDLDDLPITLSESLEGTIDDAQEPPGDSELLAAAATAVEGMGKMISRRTRRLRQQGVEVDVAGRDQLSDMPASWARSDDPVAAAVSDIAGLARTAIALHRRLQA